MAERWKEIDGTNGKILISNYGRVKSLLRDERILKAQPNYKGYMIVRVTINRQKMSIKVHREVAKAFVCNSENKPQVNHMDGEKNNNRFDNLEWVTNQENAQHAVRTGLWKSNFKGLKQRNKLITKPILAIDVKTNEKIQFKSMRQAEKYCGTRHINEVIAGKRKQANGYTFFYAEKGVI